MTCNACGEKPKNTAKDFTKAVIEINNPETLVLLRKVTIPASMGTEEDVPAAIGKYHNVILHYEANGHNYLYSSDGIPTRLEADVPQEIYDRIEELEDGLGEEATVRAEADAAIEQEIEDLKNSPDVVDIVPTYAALQTYDTSKLGDNDIIRVLQDEQHDGQSSYYRWDKATSTWTFIGTVGDYYTKRQTDTLLADKQDELIAGQNIQIEDNTISATDTTYTAGAGLNLTGTQFSVDTTAIATQSDLTTGLATKQDTLTAGANIQINNDTISATDTTYSDFVGTDGTSAGASGLVPAPTAADTGKVLGADGAWITGGPTVVQTVGTSTTDVMSQNATTNMVFADPGTRAGIAIGEGATARIDTGYYPTVIGSNAHAGGANYAAANSIVIGRESTSMSTNGISIGYKANTPSSTNSISIGTEARANASSGYAIAMGASAKASGGYSVAIGYKAETRALSGQSGQVALGAFSVPTQTGQVDISLAGATAAQKTANGYAGSEYRLLTGLYDPQNAHDAANKEYVDSLIAALDARIAALENS